MIRHRLPLVLSGTALVVAVLGSTSLGQAAGTMVEKVVPLAKVASFATNAGKLNGRTSSPSPRAGQIPVVGSNGRLSAAILGGGAAGATGSPGPAGPQGPKGDAGVSGYEQVPKSVTVAGGQPAQSFDIDCPAGKSVLSGGYSITPTSDIVAWASRPKSASTWTVVLSSKTNQSDGVSLFVVCANVS